MNLKIWRRRAGMALVVTLALIVLVTVAAMAFFARATANRTVEVSRTNQILAVQVAETGQAYVTGRLVAELSTNSVSTTVGNTEIFRVTNAVGMLPERRLQTGISTNDTNFSLLIRQSVPSADTNASTNSTTVESRNGRTINASRWNAPTLVPGNGFATNQVPNWIYLNRDGTVSPTGSDETIGRFAYNLYDTGGLLDINLSGNPGLTGTTLATVKSTLAGAVLTNVPGFTNQTTFSQWRNPGVTGSSFVAAVQSAATNGFATFSSKPISSRQDLIRIARSGLAGFDTNALPFLRHTSRSSNGPVAGANSANATINPYLPNVRVSGSFVRSDGTTAQPGESLVKTRFPLSRLAGIAFNGINSTGNSTRVAGQSAPATAATIRRDFGLEWNSGASAWTYIGATGSSPVTSINTLAEVATQNREPNFFELLKATITAGSLGKAAAQPTLVETSSRNTLEGDLDLQVLRIGACIIDQADTDNFPTRIRFGPGNPALEVAGVEDLPYLASILTIPAYRWSNPGGGTRRDVYNYAVILFPKLWTLHQSSTPPSTGPGRIRVRIASGTITGLTFNVSGVGVWPPPSALAIPQGAVNSVTIPLENNADVLVGTHLQFPQMRPIEIPSSQFGAFRASMAAPRSSNTVFTAATNPSVKARLAWFAEEVAGFILLRLQDNTALVVNPSNGFLWPTFSLTQFQILVEYLDNNNQWRAYDTFGGNPSLSASAIDKPMVCWSMLFGSAGNANMNTYFQDANFAAKLDPRTTRWGPSGWGGGGDGKTSADNPPVIVSNRGLDSRLPFSNMVPAYPYGLWPEGDTSPATAFNTPGVDNVWRPNDAYLGASANPGRNLADASRRPVILQRPFRSAGELSYVFRDTPWQTLNVFHSSSGDAALIDVFTAFEQDAVESGTINPNSAPQPVLAALLDGSAMAFDDTVPLPSPGGVAGDFLAFRSSASGYLTFVGGFSGFLSSSQFNAAASEILKTRRESIVRSLSGTSRTRTWSVLSDVIAQTGRWMNNTFIVEGESRIWNSLALDRITGEMLQSRSEHVPE